MLVTDGAVRSPCGLTEGELMGNASVPATLPATTTRGFIKASPTAFADLGERPRRGCGVVSWLPAATCWCGSQMIVAGLPAL